MWDAAWWGARAEYDEPGRLDDAAMARYRSTFGRLVRLAHRPTIDGVEHLPRDRPFLLVANHSAGIAIAELASLALLLPPRLGGRRLAGLAHPFGFHVWPVKSVLRWTGAIPSTYDAAHDALSRGAGVLIFPGGDYECSRPFWEADRVDFNRRKGFLRIAREAGIPIVPMGIVNSHWTVPILARSTTVLPWLLLWPRLFGVKRLPVSLLGLAGVAAALALGPAVLGWPLSILLAWLWLASPLQLVPIVPVTLRFRIGEPIEPDALFPSDGDAEADAAVLEDAYDAVVGRIQALVTPGREPR